VHLDVPDHRRDLDRYSGSANADGARGIGEIGITGVGAAVANAVYNARAGEVRDLPSRSTSCYSSRGPA
jgi:xanthine dehydrogenase YagR molybdenum-binding subunit